MPMAHCTFTAALVLTGLASLLALADSAHAENWTDYRLPASTTFFQIDLDSVQLLAPGRFSATWRTGFAKGQPYFLKRGVVDCASESLQLETSAYVETDPVLLKHGRAAPVTNFQSATLSGAERARMVEFPTSASLESQFIHEICGGSPRLSDKRRAGALAIQKEIGCGSSALGGSPACADDDAILEAVYALVFRMGQAQQACQMSSEQMSDLLTSWLADVPACTGALPSCGLPLLRLSEHGLNEDLARAAAGEACRYLPQALTRAAEGDERRAATARFQACVKRSIPELDDRVSSADVIASGAFGACRRELPAYVAQDAGFEAKLRPGLTTAVLEFRRLSRQSGAAKPKKPVPKT